MYARIVGWIMFGTVYGILRLHFWGKARLTPPLYRLLRPSRSHRMPSTGLEGFQTARTVIGMIALVMAHLLWSTSISESMDKSVSSVLTTPAIVALLVVLCATSMAALARRGMRRRMLSQVWIPIRTVLLTLAVYSAAIGLMAAVTPLLSTIDGLDGARGELAMAAMMVLLMAFTWAFVVSALIGLREISRHHFRATDGHPALRAIIIIAVSCWTIVAIMIDRETETRAWNLPENAALVILGTGPLMNIAFSLIEIRRLRLHGISLRQPAYPTPARRPSRGARDVLPT